MKILCLSNGHGEDTIAVQILKQLQSLPQAPELAALPLVGEGHAYAQVDIPIIAPVQSMPSGGFIYMDGRQLGRDLRGGLVQLTWAQYQAVRKWGSSARKSGKKATILAVGDIVPLLFAWLSGSDYAFVGTAKSEYYLRDEAGWLPQTSRIERWLGSVYHPWERWLMSRERCKAVFPRDSLTTKILEQWSIPAFDLGNPMMDGLETQQERIFWAPGKDVDAKEAKRLLTVTLLPGSRAPEAHHNWQQIILALGGVRKSFRRRSLLFLAAIAPALDMKSFEASLTAQGWNLVSSEHIPLPFTDEQAVVLSQENATVVLTQNSYRECLQRGDFAIAMAGTATEQFVGLGKPALSLPGEGPQFTPRFAEAQSRLLGASVTVVKQPESIATEIHLLLRDPDRLQLIQNNGRRRLGKSGSAGRIAACLQEKFSRD